LGSTREAIGFEKAGIFRAGIPAICGDENPPVSLIQQAQKIGAPLFCQGKDFSYYVDETTWHWFYQNTVYNSLPVTTLAVQNSSCALMAISLLQSTYPLSLEVIKNGLMRASLPARFEIVYEPIIKVFDVAHNPAAIKMLRRHLQALPQTGKNLAVFSMLADKDMFGSLETIAEIIDHWFVAPLSNPRATTKQMILNTFYQAQIQHVVIYPSIKEAYAGALSAADIGDKIIIFGSFHTVSEVMLARQSAL
jgi:dihydrofolate synthase/folylpolyglutamate synthase